MMRSVRQVVTAIATIVGSPDTTPMSARLPTNEEKSHLEDEAQGMNHLKEREGVEMIVMNEDTQGEVEIRRRRTSTPRATQEGNIKLMLVNGFLAPTPTTTPREAITPTPTIVKMMVLPELL
jgi:hypothetical protein